VDGLDNGRHQLSDPESKKHVFPKYVSETWVRILHNGKLVEKENMN